MLAIVLAVLGIARLVDPPGEGEGGSSGSAGSSGSGSSALSGSDDRAGQCGMTPPSTPSGLRTEPGPDDPMTRFTDVRAGADGRSVDVTFYGGVDTCYGYAIRADETAKQVALSLSEQRRSDGPCIDLAQEYQRSVPLDAPLDGRRVVDAATGDVLLNAPR